MVTKKYSEKSEVKRVSRLDNMKPVPLKPGRMEEIMHEELMKELREGSLNNGPELIVSE